MATTNFLLLNIGFSDRCIDLGLLLALALFLINVCFLFAILLDPRKKGADKGDQVQ